MKFDSRNVVLFDRRNLDVNSYYSLTNFIIEDQVTITAVNMEPEDSITFEVMHLKSGTMPELCGCLILPGDMPATNGASVLMCDECMEDGTKTPVRLTLDNPVVVLEAPQGVIIRAVYDGPGVGMSTVWMVTGTDAKNLTPAQQGCPTTCCVPDPNSWKVTGLRYCNTETGMVEEQYVNNCGTTEWREVKEIEWLPTGPVFCNRDWNLAEGELGTTSVLEVNDCGDQRMVDGDPQRWVATGVTRCRPDSEDVIEIQVVNQCGDLEWLDEEEQRWEDTGYTRCENNVVQRQQINLCGQIRWQDTDEGCGFVASYPLPCGGSAYRPDDPRDPEATVELTDCEGEAIAYIYPTPRPHAKTPVHTGCDGCDGELIGFAVDETINWKCDSTQRVEIRKITRQAVQFVERNGVAYVLWSDGKLRPLGK